MLIWVGPKLPIACPFADALVKFTAPKLASSRIPPLAVQQGASALTSAEAFAAPLSDLLMVWLQPWVVSEGTRV
jgi:hypothetical protein